MKAYVFWVDENGDVDDISAVFTDRKKALEFWTYTYVCYPEIQPDIEQIEHALDLFKEAEKSINPVSENGANMQVKEIEG